MGRKRTLRLSPKGHRGRAVGHDWGAVWVLRRGETSSLRQHFARDSIEPGIAAGPNDRAVAHTAINPDRECNRYISLLTRLHRRVGIVIIAIPISQVAGFSSPVVADGQLPWLGDDYGVCEQR